MDIKQLMTFKKVVEAGGITAAAKALNYAQPTVTLHIHELEEELQVQLFNRIGRRLLLTDAGRELYDCSRDMTQIVKKISEIGKDEGQQRGTLHLAISPAIVSYILFDMLSDFIRRHPLADVCVVNDHDAQRIYEQLCSGSVDFVILNGKWHNRDNITVEPLESYDLVLVAGTEFDTSKLNLTEPNRPLGCRFITNHYFSSSRKEIEKHLQAMNISFDGHVEVWSVEIIKKMVEQNLGFSFLPRFVVEKELREGRLVEIQTDIQFEPYTISLAYLKNKWVTPLLNEFHVALLNRFADHTKH